MRMDMKQGKYKIKSEEKLVDFGETLGKVVKILYSPDSEPIWC